MQSFCVAVTCAACAFVERIYVVLMDYVRWSVHGIHAQDAFPYLTADERDCIISNLCLDCIDEMYQGMREDEDEWTDEDVDELFEPYGYSLLDPESDMPEYESDYYVDCD